MSDLKNEGHDESRSTIFAMVSYSMANAKLFKSRILRILALTVRISEISFQIFNLENLGQGRKVQ